MSLNLPTCSSPAYDHPTKGNLIFSKYYPPPNVQIDPRLEWKRWILTSPNHPGETFKLTKHGKTEQLKKNKKPKWALTQIETFTSNMVDYLITISTPTLRTARKTRWTIFTSSVEAIRELPRQPGLEGPKPRRRGSYREGSLPFPYPMRHLLIPKCQLRGWETE